MSNAKRICVIRAIRDKRQPCIKGTRIWVSLILDFLASGMTAQEILEHITA